MGFVAILVNIQSAIYAKIFFKLYSFSHETRESLPEYVLGRLCGLAQWFKALDSELKCREFKAMREQQSLEW